MAGLDPAIQRPLDVKHSWMAGLAAGHDG